MQLAGLLFALLLGTSGYCALLGVLHLDLKTLLCAVGKAGGIPQGVGGISKNVAEHIIQTQAAMLTMVV